jgi:hypothetical protein
MTVVKRTLQECIDLFNNNISMQPAAIRKMEELGEWVIAAEYWKKINRKLDADACELIAESNRKGDEYREAVSYLTDWVEDTVSKGIKTKEQALKIVYPKMYEIYKRTL